MLFHYDLKEDVSLYVICEKDETKSVIYFNPRFYSDPELSTYKKHLFDLEDWKGKSIFDIQNTKWKPPRLQRWSHLNKLDFHNKWNYERWSHIDYPAWLLQFQNDTSHNLQPVFETISQYANINVPKINSVLVNKYTDNNSSIHLHQDVIPEFGIDPTITTASFGATRQFNLKRFNKISGIIEEEKHLNLTFQLNEGSVLIMAGTCQKYYAHEIAKSLECTGTRISCVFRQHSLVE